MMKLQSNVLNLANEAPAAKLYDYTKKETTIESDLENLSDSNSEHYKEYQFSYADLGKISFVVASLDAVRPGDIIFGNDGMYKLGIITEVDGSSADKSGIHFVWVNPKKGYVEETTWSEEGFTETSDTFHIRRLLKKAVDTDEYTEAAWDVCDCRIASAEATVGNMYEQTQTNTNKLRYSMAMDTKYRRIFSTKWYSNSSKKQSWLYHSV